MDRVAAIAGNSLAALRRVLGIGGSSSRMIRRTSSSAASRNRWCSNGASGVDVELVELGPLGAHVFHRAHDLAKLREHRSISQPLGGRFGHAKIDDLRHGSIVVLRDQDIGGLNFAANDALLMRVLHRSADWKE
jgi:hypothetical protein